jgi:uncharacterized protein
MRIVLDTNILVRGNVKAKGPAREILLKIAYGHHVLITSPFLLREVERVLLYPRLQELWSLTLEDVQEHVQFLFKISQLVHPVLGTPVVLKDPNDDPVVYTAAAGKADILCTLDRHFFEPEVIEFCGKRGITLLSDVELIHRLGITRS